MQRQFIILGVLVAFLFSFLPHVEANEIILPPVGGRVYLSHAYNPPVLKGIKVHPDNPFKFEFILDCGDTSVGNRHACFQSKEPIKLIKYFLASLTIPEKDLWVNLSPYEKNRIVPDAFGQTEMGRDLLAQDYMLKQITASLIYPEDEIGKKFWKRVYEEAGKKFGGSTEFALSKAEGLTINTFNKVWIMPDKAVVYENVKAGTAYVVESKLKVMLEEDYLALNKNSVGADLAPAQNNNDVRATARVAPTENKIGSQIIREVIIPALTKEINQGQNFAQLRQVYNSLILATWYKKKIKDSIPAPVALLRKAKQQGGIQSKMDPRLHGDDIENIYQQYIHAFKKGAYNLIKEDQDPVSKKMIPRKYFSGGANFRVIKIDPAVLSDVRSNDKAMSLEVNLSPQEDLEKYLFMLSSVESSDWLWAVSNISRIDLGFDQLSDRLIANLIDPLLKDPLNYEPRDLIDIRSIARENTVFAIFNCILRLRLGEEGRKEIEVFNRKVIQRLKKEADVRKSMKIDEKALGKHHGGQAAAEIDPRIALLETIRLLSALDLTEYSFTSRPYYYRTRTEPGIQAMIPEIAPLGEEHGWEGIRKLVLGEMGDKAQLSQDVFSKERIKALLDEAYAKIEDLDDPGQRIKWRTVYEKAEYILLLGDAFVAIKKKKDIRINRDNLLAYAFLSWLSKKYKTSSLEDARRLFLDEYKNAEQMAKEWAAKEHQRRYQQLPADFMFSPSAYPSRSVPAQYAEGLFKIEAREGLLNLYRFGYGDVFVNVATNEQDVLKPRQEAINAGLNYGFLRDRITLAAHGARNDSGVNIVLVPWSDAFRLENAPLLSKRRAAVYSGIVFKGGVPYFIDFPPKEPLLLDYVVNFEEQLNAAIDAEGIPMAGHGDINDYLEEKDITTLLAKEAGVLTPKTTLLLAKNSTNAFIVNRRSRNKDVMDASGLRTDFLRRYAQDQLLDFLEENNLSEGVIKPNRGIGGESVMFYDRNNLGEAVDHVTGLLLVKENVLLQERIKSYPVILKDQRQDWNVRVFVSRDAQGRAVVSDMVVRIGSYGTVINGTQGAFWMTLEGFKEQLGLDELALSQLKDAISKVSTRIFNVLQEALVKDGRLSGHQTATDYMGVDIIVDEDFKPHLIEANGFNSGGGWPLDQVLTQNGEDDRKGQWAKDYMGTMKQRGHSYRESLQLNPAMNVNSEDAAMKGGIDLTPKQMDKAMQGKGGDIQFHLDPAQIARWENALGVSFEITAMQPISNIPRWLGVNEL